MLRRSPSARRATARRFGSALTVALALAGGAMTIAAVTASPAAAQRNARNSSAPKPQNSEAFVKAYEPVAAIVSAEGGDYAAAKAQLPGVIAAIQTPDDRNAAGNMILTLGNKLKDTQLQRQGLELMVASGKTDPAQLGQFQFFIGSLAYDARDWAPARAALQAAMAAGYTEGNPFGFWDSEFGFFTEKANIIATAVIGGGLFIVALIWYSPLVLLLPLVGTVRLIYGYTKLGKDIKYRQQKQRDFLTALRGVADNSDDGLAAFFFGHYSSFEWGTEGDKIFPKGGHWTYRLFPFIFSTATDPTTAQIELRRALYNLSQKPASSWLPK